MKNGSIYDKAKANNNLVFASIELLTKCNWRCKHCYLPSHDHDGLPKEKVFDVLKQLRALGCFELEFTGGEIFYREDAIEILKKARELGFNVVLLSNISMLNEYKIKELASMYISRIECTVFSLNEEVHDSITGVKGSLKKCMENAILLKKYNIKLKIKTVLMKENMDSYMDLKEFCDSNDFGYLATTNIYRKTNGDTTPQELSVPLEKGPLIISEIDEIREFTPKVIDKDTHICNSLRYSLMIDTHGIVYPCTMLRIDLGNVYEDTLSDIWYNSKELIELKRKRWSDLHGCLECDKKELCYRCAGVAFLETGDYLGKCPSECINASIRYSQLCNENESSLV